MNISAEHVYHEENQWVWAFAADHTGESEESWPKPDSSETEELASARRRSYVEIIWL